MIVQETLAKVETRTEDLSSRARHLRMAACVAVLIGAGAWIVMAHLRLLAVLGIGAVVHLAASYLRILLRKEMATWTKPRRRRAVALGRKLLIGLVLVAVVAGFALRRADRVDLGLYLLAIGGYTLLGAALSRWRKDADRTPRWGPRILGGAVALGLASLVVATVNVSMGWLAGLLLAVLVAPVGIALVAEDEVKQPRLRDDLALAAGVAAVAAGLAGLSLAGIGALQSVGLTLGLLVIVAAISSDSSHDIVLVVLAITLFWSLDPQIGTVQPDPAEKRRTIVALGDSYMSGEGASVYYEGTNHNHGAATRNECRRADTAYVVRTQERLAEAGDPYELLFLACSGAKAIQLTTTPQYRGEPTSPWSDRDGERTQDEIDEQKGLAQIPQALEALEALELTPEWVIVSIGGNDAAFGEIGQTCGLAGDCSVMGEEWLTGLAEARGKISAAYGRIRAELPDSRVLVVPYPVPLNESGCMGSLLRPNEHRFLVGYTRALDRVLEEEAASAGFDFLARGVDVFTRYRVRICDTSPAAAAVNQLAASPVAGVFLQQVSPRGWFHNTFHPNERGHELIAKEVAEWISGTAKELPRSDAATTLEGIMGEGFDHCGSDIRAPSTCHVDRASWMTAAMARLLWAIVLPALLVVAGAMLLSVVAMHRWRAKALEAGRVAAGA